jgi:hypothetical protein
VQVEALRRRSALVARYQAWAVENERTFTIVRSADRAFEFLVNGATISLLTPDESATATAAVQRWAGLTAATARAAAPAASYDPLLDAYNPALDRRYNR